MSSLHNDLHSWAAKARKNGHKTIEIDISTADAAANLIVELSTKIAELEHESKKFAKVPHDLIKKIWAQMYWGVGGDYGIDDKIAQWNLDQVVEVMASADSFSRTDPS